MTPTGFLIHCDGSKILRCLNLEHFIPGKVVSCKLDLFTSANGRSCVAVSTVRDALIFELADADSDSSGGGGQCRHSFVLRRRESVDALADVCAYDFLGKGGQQLRLKVSNSAFQVSESISGNVYSLIGAGAEPIYKS